VQDGEQLYDIGGHWVQGGIGLVIMYDYLHGFKGLLRNKRVARDA
jgi:hypothetical protein